MTVHISFDNRNLKSQLPREGCKRTLEFQKKVKYFRRLILKIGDGIICKR